MEFEEKMVLAFNFVNKKIIFLHFWILQHVCKDPKGIDQYFKNIKILFFGFIIH